MAKEQLPPGARYRDVIVAAFCGLLLLANVGATKLIELGPLVFDGGAVLFPLTYILGDVIAEVYGFRAARRAIVTGFALAAIASISFLIVDALPPAPGWDNQAAWHAVLGFVPRIVVASLAGYLVGQLVNAEILVWLRDRAEQGAPSRLGRLWARLLASSVLGEAADTILFCSIAYFLVVDLATLGNYIVVGYAYKMAVEIVFLPVTAWVIGQVKARERDDSEQDLL